MQNCGIRNGGMGHEFALELLLIGILVLNHPKLLNLFSILKSKF